MRPRALILGATGVVGRNLLRHLLETGGWEVIAVSRRKPDVAGAYMHLAIDLLDRETTMRELGRALGITHVFYAAYVERPSHAEAVAPNLAMLRNTIEALEPVSPHLAHVNLMHGTKWYGNHLGPFRTPAREDDPRHLPPNFYYDQHDWIVERQKGKQWTWSSARPHAVCGYATGNPMNLVMAIAVYATVCKALGLPLRFPGSEASWRALYQCSDADLLAQGMVWMACEPRCANQSFNMTNGDLIRWENVWPRIAAHFGMETGPRQQVRLVDMMRDKGDLWTRIAREHGLAETPYENLVLWNYADYVFSTGYDVISSMTKARSYGFDRYVDTEEMLLRLFGEFAANRVIPGP